jgi:hypothetical protein
VQAHRAYRLVGGELSGVGEAVLDVGYVVGLAWDGAIHDTACIARTLSSTMRDPIHRQGWASQVRCAPIRLPMTGSDPHKTAGHASPIN